jgi:hypothetical protein
MDSMRRKYAKLAKKQIPPQQLIPSTTYDTILSTVGEKANFNKYEIKTPLIEIEHHKLVSFMMFLDEQRKKFSWTEQSKDDFRVLWLCELQPGVYGFFRFVEDQNYYCTACLTRVSTSANLLPHLAKHGLIPDLQQVRIYIVFRLE